MSWGTIAVGVGSAAGAYFGSKGKKGGDSGGGGGGGEGGVNIETLMPSWQRALGSDLSGWVRKYLQMYEPGKPYEGKLSVTDPTSYEKTGLNQLGTFLEKPPTGDLYSSAKGHIMDTLGGKFSDPATSPFIQSISKLAGQNLQDAITTARGQRGARGTYFTKAGIQEESRLSERTQNALNAVIGDFQNQERGRQITAAPIAQSLDQYGELTAPLQKMAASQTLGSLPRILEQADLERQYADFKRQRSELSDIPNIGTTLFGSNVPTLTSTTSPESPTTNILSQLLGGMDFSSMLGGSGGSSPSMSPQSSGGGGGSGQWMDLIIKLIPIIMSSR